MLTTGDLRWVAGLLEGEGCFSIKDGKYISVECKMTDLDVLQELKDIFKLGNIKGPYKGLNNVNSYYAWQVSKTRDAVAIMMTIYPLMFERRQERIRELLTIWRSIPIKGIYCKWGHKFTKENTYIDPRGVKVCRVCSRLRDARRRKERKQDGWE